MNYLVYTHLTTGWLVQLNDHHCSYFPINRALLSIPKCVSCSCTCPRSTSDTLFRRWPKSFPRQRHRRKTTFLPSCARPTKQAAMCCLLRTQARRLPQLTAVFHLFGAGTNNLSWLPSTAERRCLRALFCTSCILLISHHPNTTNCRVFQTSGKKARLYNSTPINTKPARKYDVRLRRESTDKWALRERAAGTTFATPKTSRILSYTSAPGSTKLIDKQERLLARSVPLPEQIIELCRNMCEASQQRTDRSTQGER